MIKLFNHFELLSEARNWDDVKEYYMAKKSADDVPMDDDLGLNIVNADPTENKMYVKWLILKPFSNMNICQERLPTMTMLHLPVRPVSLAVPSITLLMVYCSAYPPLQNVTS